MHILFLTQRPLAPVFRFRSTVQLVVMSEPGPNMAAANRPKETPEEKKARKEAEKKAKAEEKVRKEAEKAARAAQRGQKAAILTAPDPSDPHGSHYGDAEVIQSKFRTDSVWTKVADLSHDTAGNEVRTRRVCPCADIEVPRNAFCFLPQRLAQLAMMPPIA